MNFRKTVSCLCTLTLLTACGDSSSVSDQMQYIKTSVMYDTIYDMYQEPEKYLGGNYHMVGTLYPGTDDDGETFYSIYATDPESGHGIGIEMEWDSYEGLNDYDRITVEGKLDKQKSIHEGNEIEILILRVTKLEKRED